jgi:hypothetical protein
VLGTALALGSLAVTAACSSDEPTEAGSSSSTVAEALDAVTAARAALPPVADDQDLPPQDLTSIREVYDDALAGMGLRLTRAALIDLAGGRYEPSPQGRHLALYAEPLEGASPEQYAEGFWTLSAVVTPDVFARWPALESYDICQEPLPEVDDSPEPPPVTQINITRAAAAEVDWDDGTLTDLLVAARRNNEVRLVATAEVRATAVYDAARREAVEIVNGPSPATTAG